MRQTIATGIINKSTGRAVTKMLFLNDRLLRKRLFIEKKCPDCGGDEFLEGPHGGLSVNIKCAGCGSKFNVCPPFFAERI